jgi:hypothetical protein
MKCQFLDMILTSIADQGAGALLEDACLELLEKDSMV